MPITIGQYKQKVVDGFKFSQEQLEGAARFINDLEVTTKRLRERGKTIVNDMSNARKEMQNNQQIMHNANHVELNANRTLTPR